MKIFVLCVIGFSAGIVISAGVFAFITTLKVIPRITSNTHTGSYIKKYENCIIVGGISGSLWYLFPVNINLGITGECVYGVFTGIFTGALAVALAEMIDTFAIFTKRINIKKGLRIVIYMFALGKMLGSLLYFFKGW